MAGLSGLPTELLEHILSYCGDQHDLYALCRVSRQLHLATIPILYRHVDLRIRFTKVPRIDQFLFLVRRDAQRAKYVRSLYLGLIGSRSSFKHGSYCLTTAPRATCMRQLEEMSRQPPFNKGQIPDLLHEAMFNREYGAFAALLVLSLPSVQRLAVSNEDNSCALPMSSVLGFSTKVGNNLTTSLTQPLVSIREVTYTVTHMSVGGSEEHFRRRSPNVNLEAYLQLPGLTSLDINIPPRADWFSAFSERGANLSTIVLRHSSSLIYSLKSILWSTPRLQSLTCEMYLEHRTSRREDWERRPWLELPMLNSGLAKVKDTLKTLVLSVEFCNPDTAPNMQCRIRDDIAGRLDLSDFEQLETLELPYPLLTGDSNFLISNEIETALPRNIRHLSLRTDMSRGAQYAYEEAILQDMSRTDTSPVAQERFRTNARMDISYMFRTTQILLDRLENLQTISVWQPMDPALEWFPDQIKDLAITCRNKSIMGKAIFPQMLRLNHSKHFDLVKVVTLFDPNIAFRGPYESLVRGERDSLPLGLGCQYLQHKLREVERFKS
ncbi:hypothetical protein BDV96DRAFT_596662 [Lophiotrema nucula]|uniref:F-box domain-containing protein n=1 Tax=Lophiotrema nucula TaxID=690887 RepID=A0A6A5ZI56_9PLEO|nr:hypothetical protein BDV96DRAFT_596662 [Lophiotrema nucula]